MTETLTDRVYIGNYPATFRPAPGVEFAGTFCRLDRGLPNEYGAPIIAVFDMVAGTDVNGKDVAGTQVGLFLIHTVARTQLAELRPEAGELVAGVYLGKVDKKNPTPAMIKANNTTYHSYRFICPDRPAETDTETTWDAVAAAAVGDPQDVGF